MQVVESIHPPLQAIKINIFSNKSQPFKENTSRLKARKPNSKPKNPKIYEHNNYTNQYSI